MAGGIPSANGWRGSNLVNDAAVRRPPREAETTTSSTGTANATLRGTQRSALALGGVAPFLEGGSHPTLLPVRWTEGSAVEARGKKARACETGSELQAKISHKTIRGNAAKRPKRLKPAFP